MKITTLPAAGTLTDNGVAVTAGQFICRGRYHAGRLKFTPAANANGTPTPASPSRSRTTAARPTAASISIQSPKTITVNVTSVNDAPAGTDKTVTTLEDTAYTFSAADFGFSDPNDTPANNLLAVKITHVARGRHTH